MASAVRNRFCSKRSASICVRSEPIAPSGTFRSLLRKPFFDPALHAGRAVEIAVVDDRRAGAVGLRQDVHHAVDVLPGQVDDRQEDRGSRQVRQEAVGIEIGREIALALRHVQPAVEDADLGFARPLDQPLGAEGIGHRRQLAQEVGAAVVDHEEMRALRIVGAAGGAAGHGQVGLGHHRLVGRRILERPVRHGEPGASGHGDQHRFLELRQRLRVLRRCVAHAARQHRAAAADAVRPPPPDRLDQRLAQQAVEAGMAGRLRLAGIGFRLGGGRCDRYRHDAAPVLPGRGWSGRSAAMAQTRLPCAAASRRGPGNGAGSGWSCRYWRSSRCRTANRSRAGNPPSGSGRSAAAATPSG